MDEMDAPRVDFFRMTSQHGLLSADATECIWCLADEGSQYVVFVGEGIPFTLRLVEGEYTHNCWLNSRTGAIHAVPSLAVTRPIIQRFEPPDEEADWILVLR